VLDDCSGSGRYPVGSPHLRELPVLTVPHCWEQVESLERVLPRLCWSYVDTSAPLPDSRRSHWRLCVPDLYSGLSTVLDGLSPSFHNLLHQVLHTPGVPGHGWSHLSS
jgi:hypothetical protein